MYIYVLCVQRRGSIVGPVSNPFLVFFSIRGGTIILLLRCTSKCEYQGRYGVVKVAACTATIGGSFYSSEALS